MVQKLATLLFFLPLPLVFKAQIKAYPIDAWHSSIAFNVEFSKLLPIHGNFDEYRGTILVDENDLTQTSATIIIDANSINTGVEMRDNHLKSEDFFETEKYPQIIFSSTRVFQNEGQWVMEGELRMHDVSKKIHIPFEWLHYEELDSWKNFRITLKGTTTINRLNYGIGEEESAIGESVNIDLMISARIFNTETINLFERPFGQEMVEAIRKDDVDFMKMKYYELKEKGDKDAIKPSSFNFLYLYLKQNKMEQYCLALAELFANVFPSDSSAHSLLGFCQYENNSLKKATASFYKALEIDGQDTLAIEMLKILE